MATSTNTFLDKTGLAHLWEKIKAKIPTKTSQLTNDSGFINTVDSRLSNTSTNPVQNKAIAAVIGTKPIPDQIDEAIDDIGALTIDITGATSGVTATVNADTFGGYDLSKFVMYGVPTTSAVSTQSADNTAAIATYATTEQLNAALERITALEEKLKGE